MSYIINCFRRSFLWKQLRLHRIISQHKRVAKLCEQIISETPSDCSRVIKGKKDNLQKVIWQYWAQGYEHVPEVVSNCLKSVDQWKGDYTIIRLTDSNLSDYIQLPDYILEKKEKGIIPLAQFSDILRVCLLSTYGGLWLDATILLTGPIPERYLDMDFFVFQRDPNEQNKSYWENAYAYYYGWSKGFRVNMLNAVIFAKKDSIVISKMAQLLIAYWKDHNELPDYFFFQILFDTLINGEFKTYNCPIESDCTPHLLQQSINDPKFKLVTKKEIMKMTNIHKLTYK